MKDIEIAKILYLAKNHKYEVACASFDLVDHIFKVEVPRSLRKRKLAVQSMSLLADEHIKYGYERAPKTDVVIAEDDEEE